jgi:rod shape-determining protein MreD
MRIFFTFLFLGSVFHLLQTTWLQLWPSPSLRIEFVWICVLYLGFFHNFMKSSFTAVGLGFITDLFSSPFLGFYASSYLLIIIFLRIFIAHIFIETLWSKLLWVGVLSLAAFFIEWLLFLLVGREQGIQNFILTHAIPQTLMNTACAMIVLPFLGRLEKILYRELYVN